MWLFTLVMGAIVAMGPADDAKAFLEQCRDGKYEDAVQRFDATVGRLMPAPRLKTTWEQVTGKLGPLKSIGAARVQEKGSYQVARLRCEFEKGALDTIVSFDKEGQIAGFFFVPASAEKPAGEAPYVDPSKYEEHDVTVGAEGWPLSGTLTLPKDAKPVPLVVLVHGSGPNDRDETLGPNTPFRDLAHGLASRGIAVLRYEKRTKAHGPKMASLPKDAVTIDSEVIDDALTAIALGRKTDGIDPKRVYVLGHSLGGSTAPLIAQRDGKLAGIILLAAADRQPDAILLDQFQYLIDNDPVQSDAVKPMRKEIEAAFQRYRAGEMKPDELIMGVPLAYWKSWMAVQPARTAAELKDLPILVLRGGRDYQVTAADYEAFQKALAGRANATFHLYPDLNHIFHAGQGKTLPSDYEKPGHVDEQVIRDIAQWVNEGR